jgi:drug/metabolite transporter (DMT)-like permease
MLESLSANHRGAAFMTAAMAGFAVEDMFLKAAAKHMPVGEVITLFGFLGMLVFIALARRRGEAAFPAAMFSRTMAVRSGFEVVGRLFYALAIVLTPLSVASAILQATPLVVVAGAAVIFGEVVGLRRWLAVFAGFAGVMLIIRPGLEGFDALPFRQCSWAWRGLRCLRWRGWLFWWSMGTMLLRMPWGWG